MGKGLAHPQYSLAENYSEWVDMTNGDWVFVPHGMSHVEVDMRLHDCLPTLSDMEIIEFGAKRFLMLDGVLSDETTVPYNFSGHLSTQQSECFKIKLIA